MIDHSNGYEDIANEFIKIRSSTIGSSTVENWSRGLNSNAVILDLGCGSGIPISKTLIDLNFKVYGIDASKSLVEQFQRNFPHNPIRCEAVEYSSFFDLHFDAILAWGLMFLLSEEHQKQLIGKVSIHLKPKGKFLFTSPKQIHAWQDNLTNLTSRSLGEENYRKILEINEFDQIDVFIDEADNFYYSSVKIA